MKIGDNVEHFKNKHWGTGRIEEFTKSGKMVYIRWKGPFGGWWNRYMVESVKVIDTE